MLRKPRCLHLPARSTPHRPIFAWQLARNFRRLPAYCPTVYLGEPALPAAMRVHIAILKRYYLDLILAGRKRLECRLTRQARPPFQQIAPGEKVLLKQSAGPIRGQAVVEDILFLENLTPAGVQSICRDYNDRILAAPDFWQSRQNCRYCSLIWLKDVTPLEPYRIKTPGMRAWILCQDDLPNSLHGSATKTP